MGLGGSIASTVKNKISGYGGNLVSNAAGAAKSPKRTGSVNHDVEGLIEKSQYIKGDKVLYYPLDIGTDANGHYLQFFIRKQANLKMTFKGNEGTFEETAEATKEETRYQLIEKEDKKNSSQKHLVIGKSGKSPVDVEITKDDNGKYKIPKLKKDREFFIGRKEVNGIEYLVKLEGSKVAAHTFYRRAKDLKWVAKLWPKSKRETELAGRDRKVFWILKYEEQPYIVNVRSGETNKNINNVGETPENEVKVGITNKYPTLRMESSIALFLPGGLKNETKPEWGETGTRISYEAQAMLAAAGGDLQGAISGGGRAAEMAMKEKVIPNLMDRAGAKYGMAYTDRMQVFFKNMGKRSFSYTFKFMPKSRAESIRVDDIVKMFRFYGSPSYLNSKTVQGNNEGMGTGGTERGQSGGWSIMRQPQMFEIVYMYKDKRNEYLNRISHCVLDSVSITYNGDNNKFFNPSDDKKSGSPAPVETQIDLSFKEIEIITKDKIDQGF